ncbi:hypothetical protein [Moorena sp. SIO4G3]|uniref:hypothetical protein n=1 Tax=Moorena sp. SIO4G3 TaxID=2607821 RepID=UPI00142A4866|nr:hypothetical protein [Moorena sp. SIO4G3]NEO79624.1 hypothetical protein [Moorena sp. SIO4G3]
MGETPKTALHRLRVFPPRIGGLGGRNHTENQQRLFPCSRFPIPDSRFPIPDSRFPFPSWEGLGVGSDSRFPVPDSRFPVP